MAEAEKTGYLHFYSRGKRKKIRIKLSYYKDLLSHDTPAAIRRITVPTLIVHGMADQSVPITHSKQAFRWLKGTKRLVLVPGAPHTWKDPRYYRPINKIISAWFEIYL